MAGRVPLVCYQRLVITGVLIVDKKVRHHRTFTQFLTSGRPQLGVPEPWSRHLPRVL